MTLSAHSGSPISLELKSSKRLAALLLFSCLGALPCVLYIPVPPIAKVLLVPVLLCSTIYSLRRYALLWSPRSIVTIIIRPDDCTITWRNNVSEEGELLPAHTVNTGVMVALHIATDTDRVLVPIFRDMLDQDVFRNLRVYLKLRQG